MNNSNNKICFLSHFPQSTVDDDADLVFDDTPVILADNHHHRTRSNALNKRNVVEVDSDVQDLLAADDDDDHNQHWLWGGVRRIRRSLNRLIGSEEDSEAAKAVPKRPKVDKLNRKKSANKSKDKMLSKKDGKKKVNETTKSPKRLKGRRMYVNRLKRQDEPAYGDDGDDDDDNDDEIDTGSGENDISENDTEPNRQSGDMDQPEKLCKFKLETNH